MITNKDLSIDSENGKITLNGNKYDLGTQGEIDTAVKDVYYVMGQMGAKNLIPRPYADGESKSYRNMTYTVNTDGTITATATQTLTDDATFYLYGPTDTQELVLKAGVTYVLSGDPDASGSERIVVTGRSAAGGTSETLILNNSGVPKEYTPDVDKVITSIYIRNYTSTTTPYNKTFKPMLRLALDTDNTYEPYAKTNKQLTDQLATKQDTLTFDTTPTDASTNPVTSGGVYTAIANLIKYKDVTVRSDSTGHADPVQSFGGAYFEQIATYESIGVDPANVLSIMLVDWANLQKAFTFYRGNTSISALSDSSLSIYKDNTSSLVIRIVYKG